MLGACSWPRARRRLTLTLTLTHTLTLTLTLTLTQARLARDDLRAHSDVSRRAVGTPEREREPHRLLRRRAHRHTHLVHRGYVYGEG